MAKTKDFSVIGTRRWRQSIPKHLRGPVGHALDAMDANDPTKACWFFGEAMNAAHDFHEAKPILFFGAQVAGQRYLEIRGAAPDHPDIDEWKRITLDIMNGAVTMFPEDPVARHNRGRFLQDAGELEQAIADYRHTLLLDPTQVETWGNIADLLYQTGDRASAYECWERAVSLPADKASARMSQAYFWLRTGDYAKGWAAFNDRWKDTVFARGYGRDKELGGIHWLGQKLPRKHALLLHGEQGLGDHVMFARFIPLLEAQGIRVVGLETRAILKRWMEASFPDTPIIARDLEPRPSFTHHCSTMDLPCIVGTTLETIPPPAAPRNIIALGPSAYKAWDSHGACLRVGIAWEGAKGNTADAMRSIPAEQLAQLAGIPGVSWVNLVFSPDAAMTARAWLGAIDGTDGCEDVLDTAAVMRGLDLVVTVDTLTAHLAGTLGVPTLLLHRFCREWRWLDHGETNQWYPSVRNLTQSAPGDWTELLQRTQREVESLATAPGIGR